MKIKEKFVWVEASSTTMVQEVRLIHGGSWVPKNCSRLLCLLQIILLLYANDMLIVGQDRAQISKLKEELVKSFDMKDLGPAKQILGMEITRDGKNRRLWLS